MNMMKRRIKRLEAAISTTKDRPRYLVTAGPCSVIDPTVKVIVPEKKPAA